MIRTAMSDTHADDQGCGCVPAPAELGSGVSADIMQARAIASGLAKFGIGPARWSAAYDHQAAAVVLRVDTPRGLYALALPTPGKPFAVHHGGRRVGVLDRRRVHGTADSQTAALFAAFLRDRAALEVPGRDVWPAPTNMV